MDLPPPPLPPPAIVKQHVYPKHIEEQLKQLKQLKQPSINNPKSSINEQLEIERQKTIEQSNKLIEQRKQAIAERAKTAPPLPPGAVKWKLTDKNGVNHFDTDYFRLIDQVKAINDLNQTNQTNQNQKQTNQTNQNQNQNQKQKQSKDCDCGCQQ